MTIWEFISERPITFLLILFLILGSTEEIVEHIVDTITINRKRKDEENE